jgi:hypothetical protein
MKSEHLIYKDGTVKSTVLDRQGENCEAAVRQAQNLGTILSDERTGPDCDTVHEGIVDGGSPVI